MSSAAEEALNDPLEELRAVREAGTALMSAALGAKQRAQHRRAWNRGKSSLVFVAFVSYVSAGLRQ